VVSEHPLEPELDFEEEEFIQDDDDDVSTDSDVAIEQTISADAIDSAYLVFHRFDKLDN